MRCVCCNRMLNDYESTLKSLSTGEYLDTCGKCLEGLGIETIGRDDLNPNAEPEDDLEDECEDYDFGEYDDDVEA